MLEGPPALARASARGSAPARSPTELVRAEGQLAELRLLILGDAGDLAVATAAKDAAGWLGEGDPYAHVIHRVVCALPARIDADTIAKAEAHLVGQAAHFGPKELGRLGRHILEVVAPELAEDAEARRLAELDANAADKTRLTMRRLGDGTTRISGRVPDAAATG